MKISCIIPAYNEGGPIGDVLSHYCGISYRIVSEATVPSFLTQIYGVEEDRLFTFYHHTKLRFLVLLLGLGLGIGTYFRLSFGSVPIPRR